MRSKLFLFVVLLAAGLGCGIADRVQKAVTDESNSNIAANVNANKSMTDKAVEAAVGETKIGIQECDDALDILTVQAENPDDNFVTKAIKKTALNSFRDQLKQSLEENKTDKKEVAKFCKKFKANLEDSLKDENSNSAK